MKTRITLVVAIFFSIYSFGHLKLSLINEGINYKTTSLTTDVATTVNYCRGAVAQPLVAPYPAGSAVKWYLVATGGIALATAPTPVTTTVGTKLYYVSQVIGSAESARITITVNTIAIPATPGTISGTASQGILVGTTGTAVYSIAAVSTATSYIWTVPFGVNIVSGQGTTSITVNFADVPSGPRDVGNISVRAVNSNDCSSTVKSLAIRSLIPAAPLAIKMTNALATDPTRAETVITSYIGTTTVLTLTATPSATANSYFWELPTGVTQLSGGTTNEITVNFADVSFGTSSMYIGVKAINGAGESITSNDTRVPATNSTARLLRLTATLPVPAIGQMFTANGINYKILKATSPYTVAVNTHTTFDGVAEIPATVMNAGVTFAVTDIIAFAFSNTNLTSVTIPNSITTIGGNAFTNCSSLYSVTVDWATPLIINPNVFSGLDLATISLYFPNGSEIAYNNAPIWTNFHNATDIISVFNYCEGAEAEPLPAPFPPGRTVLWYEDASAAFALPTAPTPDTSVVGTTLFFVAQIIGGVESPLETITVNVNALPETPAAIMGNAETGTLVGTANTTTYSINPIIDAVSYIWTAPAGVNILSGQGTTEITVNFANVAAGEGEIGDLSVLAINSNNCSSMAVNRALFKLLPLAPATIKMTDATLPVPASGIETAVTTFSQYMGTTKIVTLTATPVEEASSYIWELPVGVNLLSGATTNGGVTTGTNVITVNFADVTNTSTYSHTRASGILTHVLRFGVKAVNGVGESITDNVLAINPTTSSTARLLTVFATAPAASSSIKMTDGDALDPTKAITVIGKFIGTNKVLTLTASASATASSYRWELPAGATQLSGSNSNIITVNFANVASGISSFYIGVIAVNGIGESTSVNSSLVPATTSTARLLRLTAGVPAAVSVVTGQFSGLCENLTYSYAIRPSVLANNYQITAPAGAVVKSDSNLSNSSNILTTPDLNFTITYPSGFVSTPVLPKIISVRAINGVGSSTTSRVLSLSTLMPAVGTVTGSAGVTNFSRTGTQTFTIPEVLGATSYVWTVFDGAEIVSGQGTNFVEIDFSAVTKTSTKLSVHANSRCGTPSVVKSYLLKVVTAINARSASIESFSFKTNEVYPVPASSIFNVDVTATSDETLEIAIYSLDGFAVMKSKSVQLKKGLNTITENASFLKAGVYIVQLTNSSSSEVITKKLIKN